MIYITQIGGAVNFIAVSDILQTSPELIAAALAADNVVIALYFAFLFAISKSGETTPEKVLDKSITQGNTNIFNSPS